MTIFFSTPIYCLESLRVSALVKNRFFRIRFSVFQALALWADAFYKSKCPSVCVSVFLSVCLCVHFLRYLLTLFFSPLAKVGCPKFLEIQTPWGKVVKRSGLRFEHFCSNLVKKLSKKKRCSRIKKKFTFKVLFKRLFASTSQSWIRNPWKKVVERSGLRCEHFCSKMV